MDLLLASEPSQPRPYAPQRDFESHKDTITHLYVDSNLTLQNVIKEMEQQHKFRATENEYKKKFREWGLRESPSKNRKDKGSCEAVEENDKHDGHDAIEGPILVAPTPPTSSPQLSECIQPEPTGAPLDELQSARVSLSMATAQAQGVPDTPLSLYSRSQSPHHYPRGAPSEHFASPPSTGYHQRHFSQSQSSAPPFNFYGMTPPNGYPNGNPYAMQPHHPSPPYQHYGSFGTSFSPFGISPFGTSPSAQRHNSITSKGSNLSEFPPGPLGMENASAIDDDPIELFSQVSSVIPYLHRLLSRYKEVHGQLGEREELIRRAEAEQADTIKRKDNHIDQVSKELEELKKSYSSETTNLRLEIDNREEHKKELGEQAAKLTGQIAKLKEDKKALEAANEVLQSQKAILEQENIDLEKSVTEEKESLTQEFENWKVKAHETFETDKMALAAEFDKKLKEQETSADTKLKEQEASAESRLREQEASAKTRLKDQEASAESRLKEQEISAEKQRAQAAEEFRNQNQALFRDFSPPVPILREEKNSESPPSSGHPSNSGSIVTSSDEGREHFLEDETEFSNSPFPDSPQSEARVAMILPILYPAKTALVDRVMDEFYLMFDYNSGVRVYANGDSPDNRPGSDGPQPNQNADQNSCWGKRKIGDREPLPPEDSDRDEPNKRPKPNSRKSDQENHLRCRFACPYYKRNPDRHSANTSCVHPGFSSVYRLKEHLYRRHALPIECPRCCQSFGSEEDCREHLRTSQACEMRFKVQRDGFNKDQETKLRSKKRSGIPLTEEEKWKAVWQILFPNDTEDDIPSPYCGSSSPITLNSPDSRELAHFEHFSRRELPKLVRRSLETAVAEDVQLRMLEDRLKNQLVDIIRNCQTQVFNLYQESRRTIPLPQAIIPPPSTNQLINCPELQDIQQNLDNGAPKIINECDSGYHSTSAHVPEPLPQIDSDLGSMRTNVYRLESRKLPRESTEGQLSQGSASSLPPLEPGIEFESEAIGQRVILEGPNELSGLGHDSGIAGPLRYGSAIPARPTSNLAAESFDCDPVLGTDSDFFGLEAKWSSWLD